MSEETPRQRKSYIIIFLVLTLLIPFMVYHPQRKYVLYLLTEAGLLGSQPVDTSMDNTIKLHFDQGESFCDVGRDCLGGKLIYFTGTNFSITYTMGGVSHYFALF